MLNSTRKVNVWPNLGRRGPYPPKVKKFIVDFDDIIKITVYRFENVDTTHLSLECIIFIW